MISIIILHEVRVLAINENGNVDLRMLRHALSSLGAKPLPAHVSFKFSDIYFKAFQYICTNNKNYD